MWRALVLEGLEKGQMRCCCKDRCLRMLETFCEVVG